MMTMQRRLAGWAQMLLAAVALVGGAHAQDTDVDPPGRVARLSEVNGQVWLYSPESAEWLAATRNQPLTTGDRLATDVGARAELQIGSTTVRLDASSELEIAQLDDEHVALELIDGSVIARVRDLNGAGQLELGTEEGRVITLRDGTYRFDRDNGRTDVTVYSGQARYEGPNSGLTVDAGRRAEFWIDSGGVAQYSMLSPVNDAFAAWSNDRDRRFAGSIAERYVSPEMTGAAELDAYGRWEQTPDYGTVWIPTTVAADWAPYSQGRWTFVRPWGWTWVDAAPWGFAPFHYGRWVYLRNNWCWTPGTRVARPVYAPALVGWVGGSRGSVSVTIGGGPAVGWFPLAPREVYVPSYRVSSRYARNLNITNVTNVTIINNVFRNPQGPREFENRRQPRAITVVPSNVMAERRPVGPAAAQYRQTPWVREIASDRGRAPVMLAPQIATPPLPARSADTRGVRPPPGARPDGRDRAPGLAERPGTSPRERNQADRDRDRDGRPQPGRDREPERGGVTPGQRPPGLAQQPNVVDSTRPAEPNRPAPGADRPAPAAPPPTAPIANSPATVQPPAPIRPPFEPGRRFGNRDQRDQRDPGETPGASSRAPVAPVTPPAVRPASPPVVVPPPAQTQERPTMRALPVQRGDERGDGRRGDERRMDDRRPQRPEMPQVVQPPRVERPAPPRPVDVPRPAAPAAVPAPPQPQAQPTPPPRAESRQDSPRSQRPDRADDTRRGDQR
ncbi:MAG: DUF6600 domain-containing protein [Pseudomonadota bacterium]